jgi:hypothetical protein
MGAVVYRSVRDLMNLVEYERDAFGYILARSNELLNYRKVLGFAILPYDTSKTCGIEVYARDWSNPCDLGSYRKCGRRALVYALVEVNGKKYSIYLCRKHLKTFLSNMVKYVRHKAKEAYYEILESAYQHWCSNLSSTP